MTAMQEWEREAEALRTMAEDLLDRTAKPLRLYERNGLEFIIQGTPHGQPVPGGTMLAERAQMLSALFQGLLTFMHTPIPAYANAQGNPVMLPPIDILSWRTPGAPNDGAAIPDVPTQIPPAPDEGEST
jgi:hypothetical protein